MRYKLPSKLEIIKIRKILQQMRYHDAVKYSGAIMVYPNYYMGEDYEFRDFILGWWDSDRAYVFNSPTHKKMNKIIKILEDTRVDSGLVISRYSMWVNR
jgi:hypothetical protein